MRLMKLIPDRTNIDFVGVRFYAFAVDGLLVLISLIWLALHGLNYGIDFTGGVLLEVKAQHSINIGAMRTQVDRLGFPETAFYRSPQRIAPATGLCRSADRAASYA